MNLNYSFLRATVFSLLAFAASASAADLTVSSTPPASGTLTLNGTGDPTVSATPIIWPTSPSVFTSLSTSGYHFNVGFIRPPTAPPGSATPMYIILGPLSFNASFVLANHTAGDIGFMVPRPNVPSVSSALAVPNVVFRVYDQADKLVWTSWISPVTLKQVPEVLPAGSSWTQSVQVPLQINGHWLAGRYVLVATVNGTPEFSATASFEVTSVTASTLTSGIKGIAVEGPIVAVFNPGDPNEKPVQAVIDIAGPQLTGPVPSTAMVAVPVRHVKTDSTGHFQVALPPGVYKVTGEPLNPGSIFPHSSTQTVTVTTGQVSEIIVKYATGIPVVGTP